MTKRCECERCMPKNPVCKRTYRHQLDSSEKIRFSSAKFWCACGAWKYEDALCCSDCWTEQGSYNENR